MSHKEKKKKKIEKKLKLVRNKRVGVRVGLVDDRQACGWVT